MPVGCCVARARTRGADAVDHLVQVFAAGARAAPVLENCLEQGMQTLELLLTSQPRAKRKAVVELLDRVDAAAASLDVNWFEQLQNCSKQEVSRLASAVASVLSNAESVDREKVMDSQGMLATMDTVVELLVCVERCGSVVLRSLSVLGEAGQCSEQARSVTLEGLRMLPRKREADISEDELSAATTIVPHMAETQSMEVRASASMALYTLTARQGSAVCSASGVFEGMCSAYETGTVPLTKAEPGSCKADQLQVAATTGALFGKRNDKTHGCEIDESFPIMLMAQACWLSSWGKHHLVVVPHSRLL